MLWEDNYLAHYGIKGQRWGLRRFQNEDGSLTPEGKEHYYGDKKSGPSGMGKEAYKGLKEAYKVAEKARRAYRRTSYGSSNKREMGIREGDARSKLHDEIRKVADSCIKKDPEFKKALAIRRKDKEDEAREFARINDQEFIKSIALNRADPRHKWFEKVSKDRYEFMGDSGELWDEFASTAAKNKAGNSTAAYMKACDAAINRFFSNIGGAFETGMDRYLKKQMLLYMQFYVPDFYDK